MKYEEKLFVEKYRPKTINECILPDDIKKTFKNFLKQKEIPNLLLSGTGGIGKTTVAQALCDELGFECLKINGSESGVISTLRNDIRSYASTISLDGTGMKVVLLDEIDYSSAQSFQPALRGFMEEFTKSCRFIMTCNYKDRILDQILSRCCVVDFTIPKEQKPKLAKEFLDRLKFILEEEKIKYSTDVLLSLIAKYFPDFRRILNEVQRYGIGGEIDSGILTTFTNIKLKKLYEEGLKKKNFNMVKKWIAENRDYDYSYIFKNLFDSLDDFVETSSIPEAIIIICDYWEKSSKVSSREVVLSAFFLIYMSKCKFK